MWAKSHPSGQILAIERTSEKYAKFKRRLDHHSDLQDRVFAAHADAAWLVPWLSETVDHCFWLYPNPEPKRRNHRIAHSKLTSLVVEMIKPGGQLTIATNVESYAEELRIELPRRFNLELAFDEKWSLDRGARSHFEKKYLARGEPCFNFEFLKH